MTPLNRDRPLRSILVGIDWFAPCQAALDRALQLPLASDSSLTLFHVIHREIGLSPLLHSLAEQDAPALLEQAAERARHAAADAGVSTRIDTAFRVGLPFVEIAREARARSVDLVVVGRHARRSFAEALIGTTAERVFRKASTPVLISSGAPQGPYLRPLIAIDMSEACGRAVELGLRVFHPSVTSVDVIHACSGEEDVEEATVRTRAFLAQTAPQVGSWNVMAGGGDPRRLILGEARKRGSDLLVLGTHGRSALAQLLVGSVAEAVVRGAGCDVLVARSAGHRFELP